MQRILQSKSVECSKQRHLDNLVRVSTSYRISRRSPDEIAYDVFGRPQLRLFQARTKRIRATSSNYVAKVLSKVFPRLTSVINFCYAPPGAAGREAESLQRR